MASIGPHAARVSSSGLPQATVIVPTFNEAATITSCLAALAGQDIGADRLQVIVVDGQSTDATAAIAGRFMFPAGDPVFGSGAVIVNDATSRPANLNRGLNEAACAVVCRVDARSRLPSHYVSACCAILDQRQNVSVVGGRQRAVGDRTLTSLGIARALNNRWAMGGARYRRARAAGPADTVYLGAFRTDQLKACGGWDEDLLVNEDFDLNHRMADIGVVWFDPALEVDYAPRPSLHALAAQYWQFGRWKARYLRRSGVRPQPRQVLVAIGTPSVIACGFAAVANRRARPLAVGLGALAAAAVEYFGADGPAAPLPAHLLAAVASAVIASTWVGGLWLELLHPSTPERLSARLARPAVSGS